MSNYGSYQGLDDSNRYNTTVDPQIRRKRLIIISVIVTAALVIAGIITLAVVLSHKKKDDGIDIAVEVQRYQDAIQVANMMTHLEKLQEIAYQYNGSRAVLFGYNASVDYVESQLREHTNYEITIQTFPVSMYEELEPAIFALKSPESITYKEGVDFINMGSFGGLVDEQNALLFSVKNLGCQASDFTGMAGGAIALIKRGECSFREKVDLAHAAGAVGSLIYNDGVSPDRRGLFLGSLGENSPIPAFALGFELGSLLAGTTGATVQYFTHSRNFEVITKNIIADTVTGDPENTIVVGSHLDSVPAGPGINDDGSGSAANLEFAIQLHQLGLPIRNRVRFCWWAAEEIGLLGSTYYVQNLNQTNPEELERIALNLNYDMIGSPNFFYGVYNGSQAVEDIRQASTKITNIFEEFFNDAELPYGFTSFDGRSDYGPFLEAGIPAGGLFTGAEELKSAEERSKYGGLANAPYDPCYHQACDTIENINVEAYQNMALAGAYAVGKLALTENLRDFLQS